jgi:hypothetical protein
MKEAAKKALLIIRLREQGNSDSSSASAKFAMSILKRDRTEQAEEASKNSRRDIAEKRYRQNRVLVVMSLYRQLRRRWQQRTSWSLEQKVAAENFGAKKFNQAEIQTMVTGKRRFSMVMGTSSTIQRGKQWPTWLMLKDVDDDEFLAAITDEYIKKERTCVEVSTPRHKQRKMTRRQLTLPLLVDAVADR